MTRKEVQASLNPTETAAWKRVNRAKSSQRLGSFKVNKRQDGSYSIDNEDSTIEFARVGSREIAYLLAAAPDMKAQLLAARDLLLALPHAAEDDNVIAAHLRQYEHALALSEGRES